MALHLESCRPAVDTKKEIYRINHVFCSDNCESGLELFKYGTLEIKVTVVPFMAYKKECSQKMKGV